MRLVGDDPSTLSPARAAQARALEGSLRRWRGGGERRRGRWTRASARLVLAMDVDSDAEDRVRSALMRHAGHVSTSARERCGRGQGRSVPWVNPYSKLMAGGAGGEPPPELRPVLIVEEPVQAEVCPDCRRRTLVLARVALRLRVARWPRIPTLSHIRGELG